MIRETRNWFAHSPLRRLEYKSLFEAINDENRKMHKLVQLSNTRWLAWEGAVKRILEQYLELETHFGITTYNVSDKCTTDVGYCSCAVYQT